MTLDELKAGGKAALARALALLESAPDAAAQVALLDAAFAQPRAHVVGITGPPGVGKSTLLNALIKSWRAGGSSVGCIAVDPSSPRSGGALLGDRTRLTTDPADEGVFFRSMAARDRLGGLAGLTVSAMVVMRALFDRVLLETVGVGQSETEIAGLADTVVFCVQPGAGDSLQYMKAGIAEIPQVVAVTKADLDQPARRAHADVMAALALSQGAGDGDWTIPVLLVSARNSDGIADLVAAIERHAGYLARDGRRALGRQRQAAAWLEAAVRERFGRDGIGRAACLLAPPLVGAPFARLAEITAKLSDRHDI